VVAFALLRLSRRFFAKRFTRGISHYLVALAGVAIFGLAIEAAQYFGPRDADLVDFLRDIIGGVAALFIVLSYDRTTREELGWSGWYPVVTRWLGVVFIALSCVPPILCGVAYLQRNSAFPQIAAFESRWERWFVGIRPGARITPVDATEVWVGNETGRVMRIDFEGNRNPGLQIREPVPDWRGYQYLGFTVYSPLSAPLDLFVRINDAYHDNTYDDRFNTALSVLPGMNTMRIPLEAVESGPVDRLMDMASIQSVTLFLIEPPEPVTLYVDDMHLE
jgi:hypothetical protein